MWLGARHDVKTAGRSWPGVASPSQKVLGRPKSQARSTYLGGLGSPQACLYLAEVDVHRWHYVFLTRTQAEQANKNRLALGTHVYRMADGSEASSKKLWGQQPTPKVKVHQ